MIGLIGWKEALGWLLVPLALVLIIHWLAWIFGWGRFKPTPASSERDSKLRFVIVDFVSTIINEFRHLLALVIVLVFATTMCLAMYPGVANGDIDKMTEGLQAVAAALGGLLGSIIGYYFGESSARKKEGKPVSPSQVEQRGLPSDRGRGAERDEFVPLGGSPPATSEIRVARTPSQLEERDP